MTKTFGERSIVELKLTKEEFIMSFNKVIIVGNLGKDPELRYTPQGNAVCNFSVATNEKRRDRSGEMQDITLWFRVTLWGKQAETASKYLTKGSPVYVEGRLRVEEWTDRDGKNRFTLDVNATDLQFINAGRGDESGSDNYSAGASSSGGSGSSAQRASNESAGRARQNDDDFGGGFTDDEEIPF